MMNEKDMQYVLGNRHTLWNKLVEIDRYFI
jgi:hypothetical protein